MGLKSLNYNRLYSQRFWTAKSSCITFYAKIYRYFHYTYCLHEESTHFGLGLSVHFDLEVAGHFGIENCKQKLSNIHKDFFCIIPTFHQYPSMPNSFRNSHFPYLSTYTQTTYYLTNPILCHYPPPHYIFLT